MFVLGRPIQLRYVSLHEEMLLDPQHAPADAFRAAVHEDLHHGPRQGMGVPAAAPHGLRVEWDHRRGEVALLMSEPDSAGQQCV